MAQKTGIPQWVATEKWKNGPKLVNSEPHPCAKTALPGVGWLGQGPDTNLSQVRGQTSRGKLYDHDPIPCFFPSVVCVFHHSYNGGF